MGTKAGTQSQPQCERAENATSCSDAACSVQLQDEQLTRIGTHTTGSRILFLLCLSYLRRAQ